METSFQSSFSKIEGFGKNLLGSLGVGLGVGALTGFAKSVIDTAGHLQDLAEQTKISAQTLSGLKSTLEQNGTTVDVFAKGIVNMQRVLGQTDDEGDAAARAVRALGLNLKELRDASPERALELVAGALSRVQNQNDKVALGAALLGKAFKEMAPVLGIIADKFDQLKNSGMTDEQIRRLDEFGDSITKISNALQVLAASPLSTLAKIFSVITGTASDADAATEQLSHVTAKIAAIDRDLAKLAGATNPVLVNRAEVMKAQLAVLGAQQAALEKTINAAKPAPQDPAKFKNLLGGTSAATKDTAVQQFLAGLGKEVDALIQKFEQLRSGEEAAFEVGLRKQVAQFNLGRQLEGKSQVSPAAAEKIIQSLKKDFEGINQEIKLWERNQAAVDEAVKRTDQDMGELTNAFADLDKISRENLAKLEPQFRELQKSMFLASLPPGDREAVQRAQELSERLQKIEEWRKAAIAAGMDAADANVEAARTAQQVWDTFYQQSKSQADQTTEFFRRATERIQDAVAGGIEDLLQGNVKSWADWGTSIKKIIDGVVSQFLAAQINLALFGPNTQQGQIGGFLGQLFGSGVGSTQPTGYGTRPAGVEGPSLPNGGFFSNPFGGLLGAGASIAKLFGFHKGGEITPGGEFASFRKAMLPIFHEGGEVPIMAEAGEFMFSKEAVRAIGKDKLEFANKHHELPKYHLGGEVTGPAYMLKESSYEPAGLKSMDWMNGIDRASSRIDSTPPVNHFNFYNNNFVDRRSQGHILATLAGAVKAANRHK